MKVLKATMDDISSAVSLPCSGIIVMSANATRPAKEFALQYNIALTDLSSSNSQWSFSYSSTQLFGAALEVQPSLQICGIGYDTDPATT